MVRFYPILILTLLLASCYKEEFVLPDEVEGSESILKINGKDVAFCLSDNLAIYSIQSFSGTFDAVIETGNVYNFKLDDREIKGKTNFTFNPEGGDSRHKIEFTLTNGSRHECNLIFTTLPVIEIFHPYEIPDEPKISGLIKLTASDDNKTIISYCGIELRGGGITLNRPKKSYGIELHKDLSGLDERDLELIGMRLDDDWILDAMYIDKARMRNKLSYEIWKQMVESQDIHKLYNQSYIKSKYVEVFVNHEYKGLYSLTERLDAKQLGMGPDTDGFLYKSEHWSDATKFLGVGDTAGYYFKWLEWEQKYPQPEVLSTWKELYNLIDFVSGSTDSAFESQIYSYISKESLIDHLLLINIVKGEDNTGKNLFVAKDSHAEPFFIMAWDLDATWGRNYKGDQSNAGHFLTFNLYDRLLNINPENFKQDLASRWFLLREQIITIDNITDIIDNNTALMISSGAVYRDDAKWPNIIEIHNDEGEYIKNWASERLDYLDSYLRDFMN